jgi:hypothetical protein
MTPTRRAPSSSSTGSLPRCLGFRIPLLHIYGQAAVHIGLGAWVGAVALALCIVRPERRLRCGFGPSAPSHCDRGRGQEQHTEHFDTPRQLRGLCHACTAELRRPARCGNQRAPSEVKVSQLPPPAFANAAAAASRVAVRRAVLMVPEGERPHPRRTDRRCIGLIDATANFAVVRHVEIIVVPLTGWPTKRRPALGAGSLVHSPPPSFRREFRHVQFGIHEQGQLERALLTVSTSSFARINLQARCQWVRSSRFLSMPANGRGSWSSPTVRSTDPP